MAGLIIISCLCSGKLALAEDGYEQDDNYGQANTITTDGVTQTHDFDPAGDEDWVKFSAVGGTYYKIATSNLGENCDTYIYLYDTDGTTVLEEDDDGGAELASQIIWAASGPGTYYVMARHWDASTGGTGTNYDISITTLIPGSLSGTVTSTGGTPLPDINIEVYNSAWDWIVSTYTDINGNYIVSRLVAGSYYLWTHDNIYVSEYYDDVIDRWQATLVTVTEGEDTPDINFILPLGGSLSGTVTYTNGTPLPNITIAVYDSDWDSIHLVNTDMGGNYNVNRLATGTYYVCAECMGGVFYNGVTEIWQATPVIVAEGEDTPDINFILPLGGSLSGTVTSTGGTPLPNIRIMVYDSGWDWFDLTETNINGNYHVSGLIAGSYYVMARDRDKVYALEYYNNVIERSQAAPVDVIEGEETSNINFELSIGGSITGVVTADADGSPISGLWVSVEDYNTGYYLGSTPTDTDGVYNIRGLCTGSYIVWVDTWSTDYISEYYDDVLDYESATIVSVTQGVETSNVNFGLSIGGSILGVVTADSDGSPIPDLWVYAEDYNSGYYVGDASTDINGVYNIRGLCTGSYLVWVNTWSTDYISEYYDDVLDYESATIVSVTQGAKTINIDFGLAFGGSIVGTISYSGSQMGVIFIGVFTDSSYTPFQPTYITSINFPDPYFLTGIAPGGWYVAAFMDVNGDENYDSGEPFGEYASNPITVTTGFVTPNINIELIDPEINSPPVLNQIGNKTVTEGKLLTFVITATDPDGDPLSYSASNLPGNASFDPATRSFNWTPEYYQAGIYNGIQFFVSDGELSDSETIRITVNDAQVVGGCYCESISTTSPESLRTEQMIGFLLPFFMVFLTIIAMIRGRKRTY